MIVHDAIKQGSPSWHRLRMGKLSASRAKPLVVSDRKGGWKVSTGDGVQTLINDLTFEAIVGQYAREISTSAMERGSALEERARSALAWDLGETIDTVGFISSDDERCGVSPDGVIVAKNALVELKVPLGTTQVGYRRHEDTLLKAYRHQTQFALLVTGWDLCYLRSHSEDHRIPHVTLPVGRDEGYLTALREGVKVVIRGVDEAIASVAAATPEDDPVAALWR